MSALAWIAALSLAAPVSAPVSASTPPDDSEEAFKLYDQGAYLEAAAAAIGGYVPPTRPAVQRLELARLAQESFSRAYEVSTASAPRPEYLCQALDVLDASAPLASDADERERHRILREIHAAKLAARHPGFTCEVGTELRPVLRTSRTQAPDAAPAGTSSRVDLPESRAVDQEPDTRASAFTTAGAVAVTLGFVGLAVMAGGLAIRSRALKAAGPLDAAYKQQGGGFTADQDRGWTALVATGTAGQRLAVAGGISGAVLLVVGAALLARGRVLATRARVSVMAAPERVGLLVEGRF